MLEIIAMTIVAALSLVLLWQKTENPKTKRNVIVLSALLFLAVTFPFVYKFSQDFQLRIF